MKPAISVLILALSALLAACSPPEGVMASGDPATNRNSGLIAVTKFQNQDANAWRLETPSDAASPWFTNTCHEGKCRVIFRGTCERGVESVNVKKRVHGTKNYSLWSAVPCRSSAAGGRYGFLFDDSSADSVAAGAALHLDLQFEPVLGGGSVSADVVQRELKIRMPNITSLNSVSYQNAGNLLSKNSPADFSASVSDLSFAGLLLDPGLSPCPARELRLTFSGTYDGGTTGVRLTLTGANAVVAAHSANYFQFHACIAPGAAAMTIKSLDDLGKPFGAGYSISVSTVTTISTIGLGSGKYPATGFLAANALAAQPNQNSNGLSLTNASASALNAVDLSSNEAAGLKLQMGWSSYVGRAAP